MITKEQFNIIEGCLLGDGSLSMGKKSKTPCFSYTSKNKDHVEFIFSFLKNICCYSKLKYCSYYDKRTKKEYTRYYFRTKSLEDLLPLYQLWYGNERKNEIPPKLKLDKIKCLFWYIGDGGLIRSCSKNRKTYGEMIKLSTHCFNATSLQNIIMPQLSNFEPKIYLDEGQPIIIIPRRKVKSFLEYIGPCPVPSYQYKWNITDYINKKFENKIEPLSQQLIDTFCKLYKNGWSYYKIAKRFNEQPNRIKYYLKKHNLLQNGRDTLKKKLSVEQIQNVKKMRESGEMWKNIEKVYGVSKDLLMYYVKSLDKK